jgi:AcrR family transcriptional regulator
MATRASKVTSTANDAKPLGMRRQPSQARSQQRVKQILLVAEQLFIREGYDAVTTNAIASGAQVPIGSLYQFFPDKTAILQALVLRYMEALQERFVALHTPEVCQASLPAYVDAVIATSVKFFADYPGYHAIFNQVQGMVPELDAIESAADHLLIQAWAQILAESHPGLAAADYQAIAFTLVQSVGMLLWLSLSQKPDFQERLIAETRRLMLSYLQSYFSDG